MHPGEDGWQQPKLIDDPIDRLSNCPPSKLGEPEQRLRVLFDYAAEALVMLDIDSGRFLDVNAAAEKLFGLPRESLLKMGPFELSPRWQPGGLSAELGGSKIMEALHRGVTAFEWWHRNAQGERFPCDVQLVQMSWQDRVVVRGSIAESSDKKLLQLSDVGRREIHERIASGASLSETLEHLVRAVERHLPGMLCSVLLLDRATNCLRHASAPSLPDFYNAAVDGIAIGPTVGSCGAAAFHGYRVVVSDVTDHGNWAAFRELTERAQIRACWSEPILSTSGEVLGTFAMYYGEPAVPAPFELKAIQLVAHIAANAIELVHTQQLLQEMNATLERRIAEATQNLLEVNQQLKQAELDARLSATAFQTHDSIIITSTCGKILRVNDAFTTLTGYTAEEVVGKTPRVLRSGRHDEHFYREMWQAISRDGFWSGQIWNRRKDGHIYLQRLTITAVRNSSGEITHFVGDGQDLTLEKQAEAQRSELMAARAVQRELLPSSFPCLPNFDVSAAVYPADQVSGDFFDVFTLADNSIGIVVADVSGHGLGPGLLMAQMQAHLRSLAELCSDPGEILNRANRFFSRNQSRHFVTMFLVSLDVAAQSFSYAGAGHQGYLFRANGDVHILESTSTPLGIVAHWTLHPRQKIALAAGDIILLATDGIEEAMAPNGNLFGRERLCDLIRNSSTQSAARILEGIYSAVREFTTGIQADDMTAVVVKTLDTQ
ncbi:MAG: SpoIIE family protein phosphatase [Planctomycetes bacterium]|nr:SpoIIE family protein phosphatase [Planctomycetota bacterium]